MADKSKGFSPFAKKFRKWGTVCPAGCGCTFKEAPFYEWGSMSKVLLFFEMCKKSMCFLLNYLHISEICCNFAAVMNHAEGLWEG